MVSPQLGEMHMAAKLADQPINPATVGHNSREIEEAERVQLLSFVSRLNQANGEVEKAKAPFDAAKKSRTQIFRLAKAAGFARGHLEDYLERMGDGTRDNAADEIRRRRHYKWLGILDQDQVDLFGGDAAPESAKDEAHWRGNGYRDGLNEKPAVAPSGCPEMYTQAYLSSHGSGVKDMQTAIAANAPKPMGSTAKAIGEKAKADFEADQAELEGQTTRQALKAKQEAETPDPEEVAKAARKLKETWVK